MVKHADREFGREIRIRACKFLGISTHHDGGYDERTFDKRKDPETVSFENSRLKMQLLDKKQLESFQAMFEKRRRLPAMRKGIDLLEAIRNHQVLLVVGSKGCGKTTQIPQMLLDEYIYNNRASECRIICLQTSSYKCEDVAERVAYERVERLGKSAIGFENKKRA